jgi:hypothetical protein
MFLHNKGIMLPRLGIFVLNCSYTTWIPCFPCLRAERYD